VREIGGEDLLQVFAEIIAKLCPTVIVRIAKP